MAESSDVDQAPPADVHGDPSPGEADNLASATDGDVSERGTPSGLDAASAGERIRAAAERDALPDDEEGGEAIAPEPGDEPSSHGEESAELGTCPFCEGHGLVSPDDLFNALPQIVARLAPYKQSARYTTCPGCDGWGTVLTGARVGESSLAPCPDCNGAGYVGTEVAASLTAPPLAIAPETPTPPVPLGPDPMRNPPPLGQPPAVGMVWDPQAGSWGYPSAAA